MTILWAAVMLALYCTIGLALINSPMAFFAALALAFLAYIGHLASS